MVSCRHESSCASTRESPSRSVDASDEKALQVNVLTGVVAPQAADAIFFDNQVGGQRLGVSQHREAVEVVLKRRAIGQHDRARFGDQRFGLDRLEIGRPRGDISQAAPALFEIDLDQLRSARPAGRNLPPDRDRH